MPWSTAKFFSSFLSTKNKWKGKNSTKHYKDKALPINKKPHKASREIAETFFMVFNLDNADSAFLAAV